MAVIIEQVGLLFAFVVLGYVLAVTKKADSKHSKLLSVLGFYIFLPSNVFKTFSQNFTVEYLSQKYPIVLISVVFVLVMYLISKPASKLLSKNSYQQKVYQYSMISPNYGYMGYAFAGSVFGSEVLLDVMMFALPLSIYTYTVGYCSLTDAKPTVKKLLSPVNIALLSGAVVGLLGIPVPAFAGNLLSKSTACMGPVSMLLTGMVISEYRLRDIFTNRSVYAMTALRLLVIPCAVAGILRLMGLEYAVLPTLTTLAMSCGMNTIVFPKLIGEDCKTGAALACISTICCCITIPFCLWLFGIGI